MLLGPSGISIQNDNAFSELRGEGGNDVFKSLGIKCRLNSLGSLTNIIYTDAEVTDAFDFAMSYIGCMELQKWFMANTGPWRDFRVPEAVHRGNRAASTIDKKKEGRRRGIQSRKHT